MMEDPLDELMVDEEQEINRNLLAGILKGAIKFTKNGEILPEETFYDLPTWKKILYYLLARKAMFLKDVIDEEGCDYKTIAEMINTSPKTVSGRLSGNISNLVKLQNNKFSIPTYYITKCKKVLENE